MSNSYEKPLNDDEFVELGELLAATVFFIVSACRVLFVESLYLSLALIV